ncbi:RNA polymerase sigma factor [Pontibaca salina]|uniref:RNA polymerase sigma factor n=1 Tax=Pontibaca salina TaxID=2795731 RepID=A0A934HS95_9RHOB|nr:RNA polymerase sigma factor [Pontibaca salina]MBI6629610.1 RNA polymerase sigma factor [Pontibaca salina]
MRAGSAQSHEVYNALDEAELVALARAEDEAAVRALIQRCNQRLFRVARGILHDDGDAEDAVQAAYVTGFTKLDSFRGEAAFLTWITRIVMNEAFGRLRRQAKVVELADFRDGAPQLPQGDFPGSMSQPENPESELYRAEVRKFLELAIDTLPEPFRLTYMLRDVEEMTTAEVADLMGVKGVTVKTRLFRARHMLRAHFEQSFAQEFSAIFPFDGRRCAGMADRVVERLAALRS